VLCRASRPPPSRAFPVRTGPPKIHRGGSSSASGGRHACRGSRGDPEDVHWAERIFHSRQ